MQSLYAGFGFYEEGNVEMLKKPEPLTESYYYILLCLANGPNHGYGIMQDAARLSEGAVKIGSGTMYGATGNMMKKGWIVESNQHEEGMERRRMYELTDTGREVLQGEIRRLQHLLACAEEVMGRSLKWEN